MTESNASTPSRLSPGERRVAALVMAVQFVLILDATLLLPLAPDLVEPLAIPASSLGLLMAAYPGAAALSGLALAPLLDRFDRRRALLVVVLGLSLASSLGALAPDHWSYAAARVLSGSFGAPTAALTLALITDEIDATRRGRAFALVFSGNALAAVAGVPCCLWLAEAFSWRVGVGVVGLVGLTVALVLGLSVRRRAGPQTEGHAASKPTPPRSPKTRATERLAHLMIFVTFAATVAMTANLSAYVQLNLGLARSALPGLYLLGGLAALVTMKLAGPAVDRRGPTLVGGVAMLGFALLVALFAAPREPLLGPAPAFVVMLGLIGARNVSLRTLATRVPGPATRARFMSLQTTAQQLGAMSGALLGVALLSDGPGGALVGMPTLARCSIAGFVVVPLLLYAIERRLREPTSRSPRKDPSESLSK